MTRAEANRKRLTTHGMGDSCRHDMGSAEAWLVGLGCGSQAESVARAMIQFAEAWAIDNGVELGEARAA